MREHMWKNVFVLIAVPLLAFTLAACGGEPAAGPAETAPAPAVTETPPETTPEATPETTSEAASAPTPEPTVVDIRFSEPEAFKPDPENPMRLVTADYPADPSFIGIGIGERDESAIDYTQESYGEYLTDYYSEAFGRPVQITVDSFALKEIDGSPGMRATYFLDSGDGYWAYMLEIVAVADRNYSMLFSDSTSDNKWTKDFNLSSRTIDILWSDEAGELDYYKLPLCASDAGLSLRMSADMKATKNADFTMFWTSDECMMSGLREGFDMLEAAGVADADTSLEDYIAIVESNNGITFAPDGYGHPAATYVTEVDGNRFFNYSTLRKGSDAFWLVSFACLESQQEAYQPQFELWANSIRVK